MITSDNQQQIHIFCVAALKVITVKYFPNELEVNDNEGAVGPRVRLCNSQKYTEELSSPSREQPHNAVLEGAYVWPRLHFIKCLTPQCQMYLFSCLTGVRVSKGFTIARLFDDTRHGRLFRVNNIFYIFVTHSVGLNRERHWFPNFWE